MNREVHFDMSDLEGGHRGYRIGQNHRERSTGIQVRPGGFSIPTIEPHVGLEKGGGCWALLDFRTTAIQGVVWPHKTFHQGAE